MSFIPSLRFSSLHGFFLRHLYPLRRDFDLLSDMLYWPMIDTALWGITGQWLVDSSGQQSIAIAILMGLIFWNIIWRAQAEVSRNLMDEIWNNNLVNLFSTSITVFEWVIGVILLSVLKTAITVGILIPVIYFLYQVNVSLLGWWIIPFFLGTVMTGWWIGLLSAGIVLRMGPKVQTVIWTLPGILLPFSAIYFPVSFIPDVLRPISYLVPTTYILENMRLLVQGQAVDVTGVFISFGLNAVFLSVCLWYFVASFYRSRELGLGRFS